MTLHSSKDVKNFKSSMLDVDDILREWELKLGFNIFHIFDVNGLKSYIAIFSTIKYKTMPTLMETKPNNLAPQLQCTTTFGCAP